MSLWPRTLVAFLSVFLIGLAPTVLYGVLPYIQGYFSIPADEAAEALLVGKALFLTGLLVAPCLEKYFDAKGFALFSMALFIVASLAGAFASVFLVFSLAIAARSLASGFILSSGLGFLATRLPLYRRGGMLGLLLCCYFAGEILGPVIGGWLTESMGFQWILLMFVPFGLMLLILQAFLLPRREQEPAPQDF